MCLFFKPSFADKPFNTKMGACNGQLVFIYLKSLPQKEKNVAVTAKKKMSKSCFIGSPYSSATRKQEKYYWWKLKEKQ